MSVRAFLKRWVFKSVDWVKVSLHQRRQNHPIHWEPKWNTKVEEGQILVLSFWAGISKLLFLGPSDSSIHTLSSPNSHNFRLRLNYTTRFPDSQFIDSRLWYFLASMTARANSYNKSPLLSLSLYLNLYSSISVSLSFSPSISVSFSLSLPLYLSNNILALFLWKTLMQNWNEKDSVTLSNLLLKNIFRPLI